MNQTRLTAPIRRGGTEVSTVAEEKMVLADDTKLISEFSQRVDRSDATVRDILLAEPAISLHDHPFRYPVPLTTETWARARLQRRLPVGFDGLRQSGMGATVACSHSWSTRDETLMVLARLRSDINQEGGFYVAESAADVRRRFVPADPQHDIGVVLGLESLTAFADDLEAAELLYGLGVRVAGLIYSEGSILGCGLSQGNDDGLTRQGHAYVKQLNDLGIVVDLAHVGDRTSSEAIKESSTPVLISHAGARGLWPTTRMKPDSLVKELADNGGVIGVEAAPNTTCSATHPRHNIDAVMDHVEYLLDLVGIDHVAFGPDVIFGSHAELHAVRSIGHKPSPGAGEVPRVDHVDGMENPNETYWNIVAWLLAHGYGREDILKLTSRNALRVLEEVLG